MQMWATKESLPSVFGQEYPFELTREFNSEEEVDTGSKGSGSDNEDKDYPWRVKNRRTGSESVNIKHFRMWEIDVNSYPNKYNPNEIKKSRNQL
jgi:hypothetical protein